VILDSLDVTADEFAAGTGWEITAEGACKGDVCVPLDGAGEPFDLVRTAERLGMALVHDDAHGLWALGPESLGGHALTTVEAPELELPDLDGNSFKLSSLRGKKVLLVSWAPYCGCRMDLPGWQQLREELAPQGVEVVTVGLEMGGAEVVRPWIEDAHPEHPSLVDQDHTVDARFGFTNIPQAVWIDEDGTIVRPAEPAIPPPVVRPDAEGKDQPYGMGARADDPERYADRIRDWVQHGSDSHYALTPDEVISRSRPRPKEVSEAAAHFALAQHLWRDEGFSDAVLAHFESAHTLQPENITYKRQAYSQYRFGQTGKDRSRFMQSPEEGEEWPFVSDFTTDMQEVQAMLASERAAREAATQ
jgi:peroxiredoxin